MIKYWIASLFSGYSYLFVKSDFVLRIGRLSKRHKEEWSNYFPPPRYGIPPGRSSWDTDNKTLPETYHKYSLFLWPGQLSAKLWAYIFLVFPVALLPLLNKSIYFNISEFNSNIIHHLREVFSLDIRLIGFFFLLSIIFYLPEVVGFIGSIPGKIIVTTKNLKQLIGLRWKQWMMVGAVMFSVLGFLYVLVGSVIDCAALVALKQKSDVIIFLSVWGVFSAIAIMSLRVIFKRIPPVLFQTWEKWPESQYDLFLTVPHKIDLSLSDRVKKRHRKYWNPDASTPASQQALHYAKGRHSLQEVILNLALFDFLFRKKSDIEHTNNKQSAYSSVRMENWFFYFLSPVWISYILLLIIMIIAQFVFNHDVNKYSEMPLLFNYPNSFAWAAILWFFISYLFIKSRIKHLEVLYGRIHEGYYHAHLELVPQQILANISQIPSHSQLKEAIESMQKLLSFILLAALPSFLLLLEIFSNGLVS